MKNKIILMLVCFFCFLTSCRTSFRQDSQKNTTTSESVFEKKEVYRDTTLFTPRVETTFKIPITDLVFKHDLNTVSKPKIYTQKNGNATAKITVVHDTVEVTASCDSLALVAKIKSEIQNKWIATARSDTANITKSTGFSRAYVAGFFFLGLVLGLVLALILILKKYQLHEPAKYTI